MVDVPLERMSREELERAVLTMQGMIRRLKDAVETHTKPEWKVRQEVDAVFDRYAPKFKYIRRFGEEERMAAVRSLKNQEYWADVNAVVEAFPPRPRV